MAFHRLAIRPSLAAVATFFAASALAAVQPARANDPLDGLTQTHVAALKAVKVPVLLPTRIPPGFRVYAVAADAKSYRVTYSDGASAFVAETIEAADMPNDVKPYRATGTDLHSSLFGTFRLAEGTTDDYDVGCLTHLPTTLKRGSTSYRFIACGSLSAAQLSEAIVSSRRFTKFRASSTAPDPYQQLTSGIAPSQLKALRTLPMSVVVPSYLPPAFHLGDVRTESRSGPGGPSYRITYTDGSGTITIDGSSTGVFDQAQLPATVHRRVQALRVRRTTMTAQNADVPMQQLNVPVHSKLLGEAALVANKGDGSDCITHRASMLTVSTAPGYKIKACRVPPYELKHVIESARLIRPL